MRDAHHEQTQPGYFGLKNYYKRTKQSQSYKLSVPRLVYVPDIMEQTLFSEWHLTHSCRNTPNVHTHTWDQSNLWD